MVVLLIPNSCDWNSAARGRRRRAGRAHLASDARIGGRHPAARAVRAEVTKSPAPHDFAAAPPPSVSYLPPLQRGRLRGEGAAIKSVALPQVDPLHAERAAQVAKMEKLQSMILYRGFRGRRRCSDPAMRAALPSPNAKRGRTRFALAMRRTPSLN